MITGLILIIFLLLITMFVQAIMIPICRKTIAEEEKYKLKYEEQLEKLKNGGNHGF